jgi:hypothetical protein
METNHGFLGALIHGHIRGRDVLTYLDRAKNCRAPGAFVAADDVPKLAHDPSIEDHLPLAISYWASR